jgi:RecG-like helicase
VCILNAAWQDEAVEEEYERLVSSRIFGAHGCGLLHGKLKQQEKEAVLAKFNRYSVARVSCTCWILLLPMMLLGAPGAQTWFSL